LPLFFMPLLLLLVPLKRNTGNIHTANAITSVRDFSRDDEESAFKRISLLSVWLFTPVILPFIISLFSQPIYHLRYTIGASLAFYLLVAAGMDGIRSKHVKILLICLIILVSITNVWDYYKKPHKAQWRDVGSYLNQNAKSGDLILIIPKGGRIGGKSDNGMAENIDIGNNNLVAHSHKAPVLSDVAFDYYFKRTDVMKTIFHVRSSKRIRGKNMNSLEMTVRDFNRVWVVLRQGADDDGLIEETLSKSYNLAYSQKYVAIEVSLFVKN
jgi:hypothetical protein